MRKMLIYFSLLFGLVQINANESISEWIHCEKAYVQSKQIHFVENKIFICLDDNYWMETAAVFADNAGFYINSFKPVDETSYSWVCPKCGKHNEAYRNSCRKCGAQKPSDG